MKKLWFKRKTYGWGWTPASWEGWVVTIVYVVSVSLLALPLKDDTPFSAVVITFLIPVILLTILLLVVAFKTGEKLRWQWGRKHE